MNPNGPSERVTLARYADDYPLQYGEPAAQGGADEDSPVQANAGEVEPRRHAEEHQQQQPAIQVDLLDGWLQP